MVFEGYFVMVDGCKEYMRGKGEGCLTTEGCRPHIAKQLVTGRLCQYYIMYTKLYNVYYKCPPQANFFLEMVVILNFSQVFDE